MIELPLSEVASTSYEYAGGRSTDRSKAGHAGLPVAASPTAHAQYRAATGLRAGALQQRRDAVATDSAFNTAISLATNTSWQSYGPETTLGHLAQMGGIVWLLEAQTGE